MKKFKFRFHYKDIFFNNRFLLIFSVVFAIITWVLVVMQFSPETDFTVSDVPVKIDVANSAAEKLGLRPFTDQEYKINITITGKRYSIRPTDISANDFEVTANTNYVDSVGRHVLQLTVVPVNKNADYEITSVSEEQIEVYFDVYKEIEVPLKTPALPDNIVPEGYYCDGAVLSKTSIAICGAATQINKLSDVYASIGNVGTLTKTQTFDATVEFTDTSGDTLHYITMKDNEKITVTVPVLKIQEFPVGVLFKNSPVYYENNPLSYSCYPSTVKVAATADVIESMKKFNVGTVDFAQLKSGKNAITFKTSDITDVKILDDISEFTVTINIGEKDKTTVSVPAGRITVSNVPDGYTVLPLPSSTEISDVVIYGSANSIENFDSTNVYADIDLTDVKLSTGKNKVKVKINLKNVNDCWAYGEYTLDISAVEQ